MNHDLSKFEPPKVEPDGLTKKLFGKPAKIPFTEDQYFRITTNVRILSRDLYKNGYGELQESIEQLIDYAGSLHLGLCYSVWCYHPAQLAEHHRSWPQGY